MGNDSRLTDSRNAKDVYSWAKAASKPSYTASEVGAIATSEKGAANGVAELDSAGKVLTSQLPSFVDDVLEYNSMSAFPATGEAGKIYVAKDTNKTYRWSGTAYVEISPSLALGETSSTAYRGDRGKTAYDHSQLTSGNPHNVTKSNVGLGNVPNVSTNDQTPTFTQASSRANIVSGEKLSVIFGKVMKFFSDLGTAAFTDSDSYRPSLLKRYQNRGNANGRWYKLFSVSYNTYNYLSFRVIVKHGYWPLTEALVSIRYTPDGVVSDSSCVRIIPSSTQTEVIRVYKIDNTTIGFAAFNNGGSSDLGFEILDVTSENNLIPISSFVVENPFVLLGDAPDKFCVHAYLTGNLSTLIDDVMHRTVTDTEKSTWNGKQNALTFDNVPTANSTNPVKSGGVYASDEAIRKWTTAEAKSVSGNPITLLDGSARNAEGLAVTCNPKQNLHGYDHPWAGGAGKNKFDINKVTGKDVTVSVSDDVMTITGTASRGSAMLLGTNISYDAESTYTLSFTIDSISGYASQSLFFGFAIKKPNNTYRYAAAAGTNTTGDKSVSVTLAEGETLNRIDFNINDTASALDNPCTFVISHIQFEKGSTATTFAPYSNECPIEGYTECVVDRDGKNLLPLLAITRTVEGITYTVNDGIVTMNNTATGLSYLVLSNATNDLDDLSNVLVKAGTTIIASTGIDGKGLTARYTDGSYESISSGLPFTPNKDIALVYIQYGSGTTLNNVKLYPMIRLASVSDATFVPYSHDTATITFGQTIYGGIVNPKTGKVTIDRVIADFGDFTWERVSTAIEGKYRFRIKLQDAKVYSSNQKANILSSVYSAKTSDKIYTGTTGIGVSSDFIAVYDDNLSESTANEFKVARTGQKFCYELATPIELTLTPAELELLKGYNYISTNGTTIALDYLPDSLLAEAENYVDDAVDELHTNFQAGVDAVYDAVVAKGSTPASHSLSDIIAAIAAIPTGITPSGTKSITANGTGIDVTQYANVDVAVPNSNSGTYTYPSGSTGGTVDLGVNNAYRYVNAGNVYNKGKADGDVKHTVQVRAGVSNSSSSTAAVQVLVDGGLVLSYTYGDGGGIHSWDGYKSITV
jgi:hypothetical protein